MISEFLRRRAEFDDLGHRIGVGLCVLIAAATVILLALTFDPRYDMAHQAAAFLGAIILAATLGLISYAAARAIARLAHRVKYGGVTDQPGWHGDPGPREMTSNTIALISGAALSATAMAYRLINEVVTGFPQGAGYASGRVIAAGVIFLGAGYLLARAIVWAVHRHKASGPAGSDHR